MVARVMGQHRKCARTLGRRAGHAGAGLGCIITVMWYGQDEPNEQVRYRGAASETVTADVAAPPAAALRKSRAAAPREWHSASVQYQGNTTQLAATDAKQLGAYVMAVVNTATPQTLSENPALAPTTAPASSASANTATLPTTAPVLRIAFADADADNSQAVFTLWTGAMRWQRTGQADVVGAPLADALATLLAHVRSLPK